MASSNVSVLKADVGAVTEGAAVTIDVLANDGATATTLYSLNQDGSKALTTDVTDYGATIKIVGGKVVYDASSSLQLQALAVGQTVVDTFTYAVKLSNGKIEQSTVSVTVTGTNDAPTLLPDIFGPHKMTEIAGVTNGTGVESNSGLLLFGDIDLQDSHTVSSALASATVSKGVIPVATQAALAAALSTQMVVDTNFLPGGLISYGFKLADKLVDFLGAGDTLTLVYNLKVADTHGGVSVQPVTFVITGTYDAVTVTSTTQNAGPVAAGVVSTVDAFKNVSDGDASAPLTVVNLPAALPAGVTYNAATHSFVFDGANHSYDHLAAGATQTVTVAYGVSDGTKTVQQTVSWTMTGVNDAPVVVAPLAAAAGAAGSAVTINALQGASDVDDGAKLTVANVPTTLPAGVTYDAATHSFVLDPTNHAYDHLAAGQTQVVTVTFGVSDGTAVTTQTASWIVTGVNNAPVVAAPVNAAPAAGATVTVDALQGAADADDAAALTVVNVPTTLPAGVTYNAATHSFVLDSTNHAYDHLAAGKTQVVTVVYGVSDGSMTTQQTLSWTVAGVNDAPVVAPLAAAVAAAGSGSGTVTVNALAGASDVDDGTALSVVGVPSTLPAGVSYDAATHSFVLDPSNHAYDHLAAGQTQVVTVVYGVSDGTVTTPQTVSFTVAGVNDAPVLAASLAAAAGAAGSPVVVNALTGASDVDDGVSLSVVSVPGTLPAGVTYDAATHSFALDPASHAYDHLAAGQTQVVTVSYGVSDGTATTAQSVSWTVTGVNDAPVVAAPLAGAAGGVSTVNALAGAADVDDASILAVVGVPSSLPAGVSYDAATHSFTLDPASHAYDHLAAGQTQVVTVAYGVSDGTVTTPQTVSWTVTGVNDAPVVAQTLTGAATQGGVSSVNALTGASDVDDGTTLSVVGVPSGLPAGVTYDTATHSFSLDASSHAYDHLAAGQSQIVTVTYGVSDGTVTTPQTVSWTVTGVNDAPVVAQALTGAATQGGVSSVNALTGASDVDDGTTLSVTGVPSTLPAGVTYDAASHSFSLDASNSGYTHLAAGQTQVVTVTYGVTDGAVTTPQTVSWTVTGVNDAPVVAAPLVGAVTAAGGPAVFDALQGATDADDGGTLAVIAPTTTLPAGVTYDAASHSFAIDPSNHAYDHLAAGQTQVVTVTYGVTDGAVTTPQTVSWTVTGVNDAPSIAAPLTVAATASGGAVILDALAGVGDVDDGAVLSVTGVPTTLPAGVTYDAASHSFALDPTSHAYDHLAAGQTQVVSVSYGVSDGTATKAQTASWTVTGVNDAPVVTQPLSGTATQGGVSSVNALSGASDVDDGTVLSVVGAPAVLPAGVTYDAATQTFSLAASDSGYAHLAAGQTQVVTVSFGISDGTVTTPQTVSWTVTGVNDAPVVAAALTGAAVAAAGPVVIDALAGASDVDDGGILSIVAPSAALPAGVTYDAASHSFALDPSNHAYDHLAAGQTQVVTVSYGVTDGTVTTAQTASWTITGVNDAPVVAAALVGAAGAGGSPVTVSALAGASDVDDGGTLSVVGVPSTLPAGVIYDAVTGGFTLNGADHAYDHLAAGQTQTVTVSYGVSDGLVTTPQSITWTVTGVNDAPVVAHALAAAATAAGASSVLDALAGASDVDDGATLAVANVPGTLPAGVTYDAAGHRFTLDAADHAYDHLAAGQTQVVTVSYGVTDGTVTAAQTASWTITGVNDAPVVVGSVVAVAAEGGAIMAVNALANASDVDDAAALAVTGVPATLPAGVTYDAVTHSFSLDAGNAAYDHLAAGATQVVTVSYGVTDGTATTAASISWTVTGSNDAPVVSAAVSGAATEGASAVVLNALANAADVDDGAGLSVVNVPGTLPAGVTYDAASHSFSMNSANPAYDHLAAGATQVVTVSYGVSDGLATTAASASWTVTGTNDAPVVSGAVVGAASEGGAAVVLNALANASDKDDGATLSVTGVPGSLPAGVTYDAASHSFSLNPANAAYDHLAAGATQVVTVSYGVTDGTATTSATASWTVTGTNDAPIVLGAVVGTATEGASVVVLNALAKAGDADDGATLSVVNVPATLPAGVTYNAATNSFSLDPTNSAYNHIAAGATQVVGVNYGVSDGTATTAATASWTITGTNDAPVVSGAATAAVTEGGTVSVVDALVNATDADDATTLSVVPGTLPAGVTYNATTHSFSLDPTHTAYNPLAAGETQVVTVAYGVSDGVATTAASISWTVTGVNDAPVGNGDLIAAPSLAVYTSAYQALGNSSGTYTSTAHTAYGQVAIGDFNGDGKLDVVTTTAGTGNTITVLKGDGAGGLTSAFTGTVTNVSVVTDVQVADLNNDGLPDLVVGVGSGYISTFINHSVAGSTAFTLVQSTSVSGSTTMNRVAVGDFNGDGKMDIAFTTGGVRPSGVTTGSYEGFGFALGDGAGHFLTPQVLSVKGTTVSTTASLYPAAIALADLNGDGKLDAFGVSGVDTSFSYGDQTQAPGVVMLGSATGTFTVHQSLDLGVAASVALGDVNGDGKIDAIVGGTGPGTSAAGIQILLNDGAGNFTLSSSFGTGGVQTVQLVDVNSDGRLDIVSVGSSTTNSGIWLNNGTGGFTLSTTLGAARDVVLANFNLSSLPAANAPYAIQASTLLANDTDIDHNALLTVSGVAAHSLMGANVTLSGGVITFDATYAEKLQSLSVGATLTDAFTYTVSDGLGGVSSATVTLTVNGRAGFVGTANPDTITLPANLHALAGLGGNDVLTGSTGDDVIFGGTGNDTLTGGGGGDSFVFDAGAGADRITDFTAATDKLVFGTGMFANAADVLAHAVTSGADVVITDAAGDSITLTGVLLSSLTAGNILFH